MQTSLNREEEEKEEEEKKERLFLQVPTMIIFYFRVAPSSRHRNGDWRQGKQGCTTKKNALGIVESVHILNILVTRAFSLTVMRRGE